jgi:hypothetical protein
MSSQAVEMHRAPAPAPRTRRVPLWVYALGALGLAVGAITFGYGVGAAPGPTWRATLINLLFWSGLAQGMVVWAAAFRVARTTWSPAVNRMGHAALWFLPFPLAVLFLLLAGRGYFLAWLHTDVGYRQAWLNVPFMWARDAGGMALVALLSWAFVAGYLRVDRVEAGGRPPRGWRGDAQEAARANRRLSVFGVLILYSYGVCYSIIGYDLVLSLVPNWVNTLFGLYFAVGGVYSAIAALVVMAVLLPRWLQARELVDRHVRRRLGNLLMAFAMLMTYLLYSQMIVIWYGNLPNEISFVIPRLHQQPWQTVSYTLLFTLFLGVFALLVIREVKEIPVTLFAVALLALASIWTERYQLVVPSLTPRAPLAPGLVALIGVGFLGVLLITTAAFLARYPAFSRLDLALRQEKEQWQ